MKLRDQPIRRKLMLMLLLTASAVMVLMGGAVFANEYRTFRRATLRELDTLGHIMAANSTAALAFDNQDDAREILAALSVNPHVTEAVLYDRHGNYFAVYPAARSNTDFPEQPGADGHEFAGAMVGGNYPVMQKGKRLGTLALTFDTAPVVREFLGNSLKLALVIVPGVLLFAYLLARVLQGQVSAPILALAETARAVSERGDYSVRAPAAGHDELGLLTTAFNEMLDRNEALTRGLEQRVVERTAQYEAANKELEAFSYSVSHDLRAPVRHIAGYAGLLAKSDAATVSAKGRGYLTNIAESARQMGTLIDDLLVFSQMGRSEMKYGPVDLHVLAEETIRDLTAQHPERHLSWQLEPLPTVRGDRAMLRQVFVNLFSNAVKYSGPRDPAIITIKATPEPATGECVVSVRDNGVGFEMAYAHKLFGVFQRLHRAEEFEGTGIGLANIRRIISRHGGRTWAEGEPGVGAVFYFSLPPSLLSS